MSHRRVMHWVGGEHPFALGIGQLRALQTACDAGPEAILRRMVQGDWRIDDLVEVLRLGLIGSGAMAESDAGPFVLRQIDQHGWTKVRLTAVMVLNSALEGEKDEPLGEPEGQATPPQSGASATSTAAVP